MRELSEGTCRDDFSVHGAAAVMIPYFVWLRSCGDSLSHPPSSSVAGKTWCVEVLVRRSKSLPSLQEIRLPSSGTELLLSAP